MKVSLRARSIPRLPKAEEIEIVPGVLSKFDKAADVDRAIATLIVQPAFARVRKLTAAPLPMTWAGLRRFCASPNVRALESLDLDLKMPAAALALVLDSKSFDRLTELTIGVRHRTDIPRGSFGAPNPDRLARLGAVDGLPALRSLRFGDGVDDAALEQLLGSPLVRRVRALRVIEAEDLLRIAHANLPDLRELTVHGHVTEPITANGLRALATNAAFGKLERLDLADATFEGEALRAFVDPRVLPSLRALDIRRRYGFQRDELIRGGTLQTFAEPRPPRISRELARALRARFGEGLIEKRN